MERGRSGFTLIELMIVLTIIVIIAAIAIPSLIAGRLMANETAAISTLRSIATAQQQFRQSAKADEDGDGAGEYGGLGELSGVVGVRGGLTKVPTDLSHTMGKMTAHGEVNRSGYVFRMYLPSDVGEGVREPAGGGYAVGVLHPDLAETTWVCYAWPLRYGVTGHRTFLVNQQGEITFTDQRIYDGTDCPSITAGMGFLTGNVQSITGRLAVGTAGADGNVWRSLQ
jgi:prepilin-type N-terminal cleavage/methylation domain-containing protein